VRTRSFCPRCSLKKEIEGGEGKGDEKTVVHLILPVLIAGEKKKVRGEKKKRGGGGGTASFLTIRASKSYCKGKRGGKSERRRGRRNGGKGRRHSFPLSIDVPKLRKGEGGKKEVFPESRIFGN